MFLHPDELFRLAHLELAQHLLALRGRSAASLVDREALPAAKHKSSMISEVPSR